MAHLWRDLPLWYVWLSTFSLLNLEVNVLGGARSGALFGFVPAFGLVTLAWWRGPRSGGRRAYFLVSGGLLAAVLSGITGTPAPLETVLAIFEVSALVIGAVLALHCALTAGVRVLALLFGVGLLYGLFLENVGVASGVFSEGGYWIYLPGLPAPLCTALGWCSVWYCLWWLTPRLADPKVDAVGRARIALGLALALDLQLDPVATRAGFWTWNELLPAAVRGVPLVNFNAWIAAVWPFSRQVFQVQEAHGDPARRLLLRLPVILLQAFLLLTLLTMITEAPSGWPSLRLFAALVSGEATRMGVP